MQLKRAIQAASRTLWLAVIATFLLYLGQNILFGPQDITPGAPSPTKGFHQDDSLSLGFATDRGEGTNRGRLSKRDDPANSSSKISSKDGNANGTEIVIATPTDPDENLTWELALSKGGNLAKLLDTEDLSGCGVNESAFTDFAAFAQYGWSQTLKLQGLSAQRNASGLDDQSTELIKSLGIPLDVSSNTQIQWDQDVGIRVDGEAYPPTNATYYNIFNTAGHIVVGTTYGPQYSGQFLSPPITGDQIVPLSSWSDIAFLQWQDLCKGDTKCMQGLKTVVKIGVDNDATSRIADQALGNLNWTTYPGRTFNPGAPEFAALLATPNVRGATWLLLQRRKALGWKHIDGIQLFVDSDDNPSKYVAIHIANHSPAKATTQKRHVAEDLNLRGQSLEIRADGQVVYDTGASGQSDQIYLYDHDTDLARAQLNGEHLVSLLSAPAEPPCVQQSKWTDFSSLDANGWTLRDHQDAHLAKGDKFTGRLWQIVDNAHDSVDNEHNQQISWVHSKLVQEGQTSYRPTTAFYDCIFGQHSIQALNIQSPQSKGRLQQPIIDGSKDSPLLPLSRFSDVVWLLWQAWCKEKNYDSRDLRMISQRAVNNPTTQTILKLVYKGKPIPGWPGDVFNAGTPQFAAILSTPNGQGTAWMLAQHKEQFGVKTVQSIRVFCDDPEKQSNPYLVLCIGDYVPANSRRELAAIDGTPMVSGWNGSQALTARADADPIAPASLASDYNSDHAIDFAKYVSKGKDHLAKLHDGCGPPSKWASYTDLAAQGWTAGPDGTPIPLFDDNPVARALDYLKLSKAASDQFEVKDQHLTKVDRDGKTYYPTRAKYVNKYNAGLITAEDNAGPVHTGPDTKNQPPVTGDPNPFPDLRQWSDVVFLEHQRLMAKHNQPLDQLKGVLRKTADAIDTKNVIAHITGGDAKDLSKSMKRWPGIDYSDESDELAALLGSPNGQGVAWLLRSHVYQLGHKTVNSVRMWYDSDANNGGPMLLFSFADVKSDDDSANARKSKRAVARRGLTKISFEALVAKGKPLRDALLSNEDCFPPTQWTDASALNTWGWYRYHKLTLDVPRFTAYAAVFNLLGVSYAIADNQVAINTHPDKTEIDGTTYYPTHASYENRYNEKLITAVVNYGPAVQGPKQNPPVTGDPNPFPKLSHWSDVVALEFEYLMTQTKKPTTNLKAVWQRQINNDATKDLATYLFGVASFDQVDAFGSAKWPGKDYGPSSDEFAALLASPNGIGVAYLLLQHRQLLGSKTITRIRVWREEQLHILFFLQDVKAVERRSELSLWAQGNVSSTLYHSNDRNRGIASRAHTYALRPRAPSAEVLTVDEARKNGVYFIDVQNTPTEDLKSCQNIDQSTFTTLDQLARSGWIFDYRKSANVATDDVAISKSWEAMGLDWKGDSVTDVRISHSKETTSAGKIYLQTGAFFLNSYSVGAIAAVHGKSPKYAGPEQSPPVDGSAEKPYPPLHQWSDVTFLVYQDICGGDAGKMKSLKSILKKNVINNPTVKALRAFMGPQNMLRVNMFAQEWPGTIFKPDDDGFAVTLGTPGGKGVAFLLATHRAQLGWKEVYQIQIFDAGNSLFNILFYIQDHTEQSQQKRSAHPISRSQHASKALTIVSHERNVASSRQRRADPPKLDYDTALKKGRQLLCYLYADVGDVAQSQWTDSRALSRYGWSIRKTPDGELQPGARKGEIAQALNDPTMHISTSADDNFEIHCNHRRAPTVDGKTYPKTTGAYVGVYNFKDGMILAHTNKGPDYQGGLLDPPVTGNDVIPLKQWSDVVFLLWMRFAGNNIKNIRSVFRWHITNEASQTLLKQILAKHNEEMKPWPGYKFSMDDQDAQAILGTPNGRGVAYLLATHKIQLGAKVIRSVTVFQADGLPALYFEIVDIVDAGPTETLGKIEQEMTQAGAKAQPAGLKGTRRSEGDENTDHVQARSIGAQDDAVRRGLTENVEAAWKALRGNLVKRLDEVRSACLRGVRLH